MAGSIIAKTLSQDVITETVQPLYIGGVNPDGSDAKLTVNTDGTMTGASALALPSLTVASKPVVNSLLAEYTVTGSAVTSIDFSGLDILSHKSYTIELDLINYQASQVLINLIINGDTTLTNYYSQYLQSAGVAISGGLVNEPWITIMRGSSRTLATSRIGLIKASEYAFCNTKSALKNGSSIEGFDTYLFKTATLTNVTQLTFTANIANSIGVGSKIRIYRGDV